MITLTELKEYYANLLILQYRGKEKARATIEILAELLSMDLLPLDVRDAFDVDTAVGEQLDFIGVFIGIDRRQNDFTSPVTLDDEDYRTLMKIKIIENNANSDLSTIQQLIFENFGTDLRVVDYKDMSMGYIFEANLGDNQLAEIFVKSGFLPVPMAVRLRTTIFSPTSDFWYGFRTYTHEAFEQSPFNTYDSYETDRPWLNYENGVTP